MFGADVVEDHFSYVDSEGDKIEVCNQDDWENCLEDYQEGHRDAELVIFIRKNSLKNELQESVKIVFDENSMLIADSETVFVESSDNSYLGNNLSKNNFYEKNNQTSDQMSSFLQSEKRDEESMMQNERHNDSAFEIVDSTMLDYIYDDINQQLGENEEEEGGCQMKKYNPFLESVTPIRRYESTEELKDEENQRRLLEEKELIIQEFKRIQLEDQELKMKLIEEKVRRELQEEENKCNQYREYVKSEQFLVDHEEEILIEQETNKNTEIEHEGIPIQSEILDLTNSTSIVSTKSHKDVQVDSYDLSFLKNEVYVEGDSQIIEKDGWKVIEKNDITKNIQLPHDMLKHIDQLVKEKVAQELHNQLSRCYNEIKESMNTPPKQVFVHEGYSCDACNMKPIVGPRFISTEFKNYNLCEKCEDMKKPSDPMIKIVEPIPNLPECQKIVKNSSNLFHDMPGFFEAIRAEEQPKSILDEVKDFFKSFGTPPSSRKSSSVKEEEKKKSQHPLKNELLQLLNCNKGMTEGKVEAFLDRKDVQKLKKDDKNEFYKLVNEHLLTLP